MTAKPGTKPTDAQLAAAIREVNANPNLRRYLASANISIEQFALHSDKGRAAREAARTFRR